MMIRHLAAAATLIAALAGTARAQPAPPAEPDPVAERYRAARGLLDAGKLEQAQAEFAALLTEHPDHPTAVYSARLLLDVLNQRRDYPAMREWVDRLLGQPKLLAADPTLATELAALDVAMRRREAEQLERAHRYGDCGRAYLDIFQRQPADPRADELLYNAGVCFEVDHSVGAAIAAFRQLMTRFPRSRLAARALIRTAHAYRSIVHYREAAEALETYAAKYGGEKDAEAALSEAMVLRRALGEPAAVRKLAERYARMYGRKRPRQAAEAVWASLADDRSTGAAARIERFLKQWRGKASPELRVIAHVRLGELLWQQSCPKPDPSGLCLIAQRPSAKIRRCADRPRVRLVPRKATLARRARTAFTAAILAYRALPAQPSHPPAVDRAFARASFALAEPDFEAYLALDFPSGLDFDGDKPELRKASMKRFRDWLDQKQKMMAALSGAGSSGSGRGAYVEIVAMGERAGPWLAAATARVGAARVAFADAMLGGEMPRDVGRGPYADDKTHAYCDELNRQSEALIESAVSAFAACVSRPVTGDDARWFRSCERELVRLRPADYPARKERHGAAGHLGPVLSLEGLQVPEPR